MDLLTRSEKGALAGMVSVLLLLLCVGVFVAVMVYSTSPLPTGADRLLIFVSANAVVAWVSFVGAVGLSLALAFYAACQLDLVEVTDAKEQATPGIQWGELVPA